MDDFVKGIEISKGEYLVFTPEELEAMRPEKSDMIGIKEFVDAADIDPIYNDKVYFVAPQKAKERAFYLFKEVLKTSDRIAIGRFVMREKEYVCTIRSYQSGLLLTTLNYKYEIRDINDIKELKDAPVLSKQEVNLATKLVEQLSEDKFDIADFRDTFADQIKDQIKNKNRIKPKARPVKKVKQKPLLDALKASLQ